MRQIIALACILLLTSCGNPLPQLPIPTSIATQNELAPPTATNTRAALTLPPTPMHTTITPSPRPPVPALTSLPSPTFTKEVNTPTSTASPTPVRTSTPTLQFTIFDLPHNFSTLESPHPTTDFHNGMNGQWVLSLGVTVRETDLNTLSIERADSSWIIDVRDLDTFGVYDTFPTGYKQTYFSLFDLDADGETEIILEWIFVGAYATVLSTILYFDAEDNMYHNTQFAFDILDPRDLDGDGAAEFLLRDTKFNIWGLNGAHVIQAYSPQHILGFRDGELKNISAEFPIIVEADAAYWFEKIIESDHCNIWIWGAYLADMHLINRGEEGWQFYQDLCNKEDGFENMKKQITQALIDFDYIKSAD